MTAKIVKNLISGSKDIATNAVVNRAEFRVFLLVQEDTIVISHSNLDKKLQHLTQYNWLCKIIGTPARLLAIALVYPIALAAFMSAIALAICFMFMEAFGISVLAFVKRLRKLEMLLNLRQRQYIQHQEMRLKIPIRETTRGWKYLSVRRGIRGYETNERVRRTSSGLCDCRYGSNTNGIVIFPIALLSALVGFIPVSYIFNSNANFRDKMVDALVLDKSYDSVKSA